MRGPNGVSLEQRLVFKTATGAGDESRLVRLRRLRGKRRAVRISAAFRSNLFFTRCASVVAAQMAVAASAATANT